MRKFCLYWHTIKYLKIKQILYRFWHHLFQKKVSIVVDNKALQVRPLSASPKLFIKKKIDCFVQDNIIFLNHSVKTGNNIWNDEKQEKLWLYNLHYFDMLNSSNIEQSKIAYHLLERWIKENPTFIGNGWEPYPLSLRIINIIKYSLSGASISKEVRKSLYIQARFLYKNCEYHIFGNHLFENFKALCFAGLYFHTEETKKWFKKGFKGLERELQEQLLSDGGHFELSPMYHCIILEGLLDLENILRLYKYAPGFPWCEKIKKMLYWLMKMQRSNNELSYFNDTANEIVVSPKEILAYAKALGYDISFSQQDMTYLSASGYFVLQNQRAKTIFDVANVGPDYLPGHAHADTLSFELYIDNLPVFVNLGTSCYGLSARRIFERGTAAHNTLTVNNENSSEVWSSFRVAKRAIAKLLTLYKDGDKIKIKAKHNGYSRIKRGMVHTRTWIFTKNSLEILDQINKKFTIAKNYFHLHPDCLIIEEQSQIVTILLPNLSEIKVQIEGKYNIIDNQYAQSFGELKPTRSICVRLNQQTRSSQVKIIWQQ